MTLEGEEVELVASLDRQSADAPRRPAAMPRKIWRRWSARSRRVFAETYRQLVANWENVSGGRIPAPPARERRVLAWNTAWMAAEAAR